MHRAGYNGYHVVTPCPRPNAMLKRYTSDRIRRPTTMPAQQPHGCNPPRGRPAGLGPPGSEPLAHPATSSSSASSPQGEACDARTYSRRHDGSPARAPGLVACRGGYQTLRDRSRASQTTFRLGQMDCGARGYPGEVGVFRAAEAKHTYLGRAC